MISENELYKKYNIGIIYVNPAAVDYFDSKFRTSYWCEAGFGELLRDYVEHLSFPPTNKCLNFPRSTDGVVRDGGMPMNDEEREWLFVEYKIRNVLNNFFENKGKFVVTCIEGNRGG